MPIEPTDQQQALDDDFHPLDAYPAIDRAFAEGWNDPKMDDYGCHDELKGQGEGAIAAVPPEALTMTA
jgi:hypothetical protein